MRNGLLVAGLGIVVLILTMMTSSCSVLGDGYRYPCQDPANWDTPDCTPPICEASGTCSADLLPPEALDG